MGKSQYFSIRSQNIVNIYNSTLIASILALLTSTPITGKVSATSIKQPSIGKYQSKRLTAQNLVETTKIDYVTLREAILAEINRVRANPQAYADWLEEQKQYFEGTLLKLPGEKPLRTNRGKAALEEAIAWLNNLQPLPELSSSAELVQIAQAQIQNLGSPQGNTNFQDQTISYGRYTAKGIVLQLIVDDGNPDRFNRYSILNPDIESVGVRCETHEQYQNICAIAYEGDFLAATAENLDAPESINSDPNELVIIAQEERLTEKNTPNQVDNPFLPPLPLANPRNNPSLLIKKIHQGKLEEGDTVIPNDGSFYDSYPLEGKTGDSFTISVDSKDFDTFLAVMDAEGNIIKQNDDISESNSNSRLKVTLPGNGVYNVIVNAYDEGGQGKYFLTVR